MLKSSSDLGFPGGASGGGLELKKTPMDISQNGGFEDMRPTVCRGRDSNPQGLAPKRFSYYFDFRRPQYGS